MLYGSWIMSDSDSDSWMNVSKFCEFWYPDFRVWYPEIRVYLWNYEIRTWYPDFRVWYPDFRVSGWMNYRLCNNSTTDLDIRFLVSNLLLDLHSWFFKIVFDLISQRFAIFSTLISGYLPCFQGIWPWFQGTYPEIRESH